MPDHILTTNFWLIFDKNWLLWNSSPVPIFHGQLNPPLCQLLSGKYPDIWLFEYLTSSKMALYIKKKKYDVITLKSNQHTASIVHLCSRNNTWTVPSKEMEKQQPSKDQVKTSKCWMICPPWLTLVCYWWSFGPTIISQLSEEMWCSLDTILIRTTQPLGGVVFDHHQLCVLAGGGLTTWLGWRHMDHHNRVANIIKKRWWWWWCR